MKSTTRLTKLKKVLKRCQGSTMFFIENFCKVKHPKAGIIPFRLFPYQKQSIKSYLQCRYNIYRKCRQCFVAGSMVWTPSGPKPIETLGSGDQIYALVDGQVITRQIKKVFKNGLSGDLYEVRTKTGHRSVCTADHKFLTKRGWVVASELTQNDTLVEVFEPESYGPERNKSDAILLGYLITDGSYGKRWINFTNSRWKYLLEFQKHFELKFGKKLKIRKHMSSFKPEGKNYRLQTNLKEAWGWLSLLRIKGQTGKQKIIPSEVFLWDNETLAIFINRMFAGDGWYSGGHCNEAGIAQESVIILHQLKQLLSRFKINSKFYPATKDSLPKLRIMGGQDFERFVNEIGIYGKQPRQEITKGFFFNRIKGAIKSVKQLEGVVSEVYDLNLSAPHNYIVDGAVVHNCGISTLTGAFALWYAMFFSNKKILIVSKRDDDAKEFLKKNVKFVYDHLPDTFKEIYGKDPPVYNEHTVGFPNGSVIRSLTSSPDTMRSESASLNIIDESGFMPHMATMWSGAQPCCAYNTVVSTGNGLKRIDKLLEEAGNPEAKTYASHDVILPTDVGLQHSNAIWNNGYCRTIKIKTSLGYEFEATPRHRIRVVDVDGEYVWKKLSDVQKGDLSCLMLNTCMGEPINFVDPEPALVCLDGYKNENQMDISCHRCHKSFTRKVVSLRRFRSDPGYYTCPSCVHHNDFDPPKKMTKELAEILGYYVGDGWLSETRPKRIKLSCDPIYKDLPQKLIDKLFSFGIFAYTELGNGTLDVRINNASFVDWLVRHKLKSKTDAFDAQIPASIFASGPDIISAFLRGLFEADGTITNSRISLSTSSSTLADQVRTSLLSLGILTHTFKTKAGGFENSIGGYNISILDRQNCQLFQDKIGFLSDKKDSVILKNPKQEHGLCIDHSSIVKEFCDRALLTVTDKKQKARLYGYKRTGRIPYQRALEINDNNNTKLGQLLDKDLVFDKIVSIENDSTLTADLSIPVNNTYIANGFVSHNTLIHGGSVIVISTCVAGNSLVFTDRGMLRIGDQFDPNHDFFNKYDSDYDAVPARIRIAADDGENYDGLVLYRRRIDKTIRVTTDSGTEVVADKKHCLYTFSNDLGWKNVDQLTFDDYVAVKSGSNIWGNLDKVNFQDVNFSCENIDVQLSYKLGLLLAEGYINEDYVVFTNGDENLHQMFRSEDGWIPESGREDTHSRKCSRGLVRFLEFLGFKRVKSPKKVFPDRILTCSKQIISSFIRGMYDGDGFSRTRDGSVGYVSTSKSIIDDLKIILLNFGIHSRIESKPEYIKEFKLNNRHYESFCHKSFVLITKGSDARKFYDEIGFGLYRKQRNKDNLKEKSYDLTPPIADHIRRWMCDNNISIEQLKDQGQVSANKLLFHGTGRIQLETLRRILSNFPEAMVYREQLEYIASPGMRFEKIKTLEDGGEQYTYDYSVPGRKRILTNGMVSHNTNGVGNWYHTTWDDAIAKRNEFNPIEIMWWDMDWVIKFNDEFTGKECRISPTDGIRKCETKEDKNKWGPYHSTWLEEQYRALQQKGEEHLFRQEVLAEFIGTGNTVLDREALLYVRSIVSEKYWTVGNVKYFHPVTEQQVDLDFEHQLQVWKKPQRPEPDVIENGRIIKPGDPGHTYSMGVDISSGEAADYSAIEVIDCNTKEQVAELNILVKPMVLLMMMDYLGRWYNGAFIVPERTGIGIPVCQSLYHDIAYTNVYHMKTPAGKPSKKVGFPTNPTHKGSINKALIDHICEDGVYIYSERCLEQLMIYVHLGTTSTGQVRTGHVVGPGNHSDMSIAMGLALLGMKEAVQSDHSSLIPTRNLGQDFIQPDMSPGTRKQNTEQMTDMLAQGGIKALVPIITGSAINTGILTPEEEIAKFTRSLGGVPIGSKAANPIYRQKSRPIKGDV